MQCKQTAIPVNMPLVASTGPVLVLCWQHLPSTSPVLAHNGMFMGLARNTYPCFKSLKALNYKYMYILSPAQCSPPSAWDNISNTLTVIFYVYRDLKYF